MSDMENLDFVRYDRDSALTRLAEIREWLPDLISLAERGMTEIGHSGSCGPWSECDMNCMQVSYEGKLIEKARMFSDPGYRNKKTTKKEEQ